MKLLRRRDVVAYFAIKFSYDGEPQHRRLTAVLRVEDECTSHAQPGDWYRARRQPLPRNVMLPGNELQRRPYCDPLWDWFVTHGAG